MVAEQQCLALIPLTISLIVWCICSKHYHIGCFGNLHFKDKIWRLTDFDLCLEADVGAALGGEVPDVHDVPSRPLGVRLVVAVGLGCNSIDIFVDPESGPIKSCLEF